MGVETHPCPCQEGNLYQSGEFHLGCSLAMVGKAIKDVNAKLPNLSLKRSDTILPSLTKL
jgi:hypothetical protein